MLNYKIFTNCNYFVNLFNFWSFATSMIAVAFFIGALIGRSKTANTVAFFVFIIGFLFLFILGAFIYMLYSLPGRWIDIFFFFPPFNFAKVISAAATVML